MNVEASGLPSASYTLCSYSTPPMPWATPPCTWPSTMFGLIIRPQSSDTTNRSTSTLPVAGSTSTVAAWVAFDHIVAGAMERWTTSSSESSSGGSVADCW